jgi:hypothetical protein
MLLFFIVTSDFGRQAPSYLAMRLAIVGRVGLSHQDSPMLTIQCSSTFFAPGAEGVRRMGKIRRISAFALLLGGAFLGFAASEARAGAVQMHLVIGGMDFDLSKGSIYDNSDPSNPNLVSIDTALLNSDLSADGFKLQVSGLQALSNNPGDIGGAFLHESGTWSLLPGGGTQTWTLYAFQTDYHTPSGAAGVLQSSTSGTFGFTQAGNSQAFKSWQDNSNTGVSPIGPPPTFTGTPSPTVTLVSPDLTGSTNTASLSGDAPPTTLGTVNSSYAIENRFNFTMSGTQPSIGFAGTSTVNAAVPEPASLALMLTTIPFLAACMMRRRKKSE